MSKRDNTKLNEFPEEVKDSLKTFHESLVKLKEVSNAVSGENYQKLKDACKNSPLDAAALDLTIVYLNNSLFWMYLVTNGVNPKEHDIKRELDRLKSSMARLSQIKDKAKAPKLDVAASKRFVKSALWEAQNAETSQSGSKRQKRN